MTDIFQEIRDRRVLPALGVYVGSCWVLIEILDRLSERYLWSPYITDAAFWGLYSLIPAVILLSWAHGKPGKDRATTAEKVGVPINIIATIGLLVTVFGGKDLGATGSMISIANEEGVRETHYIASESFRRRMAVFFFENESLDPGLDWLQYGVTELLVQDLQQSPFVLASSPWANYGNGFYMRMKQAGYKDGTDVPISLMRQIANDANRQYFVEGDLNRLGDEYVVTARVWETQSLTQVAELFESGYDLYNLVDALSIELRDALDVPQGSARMVPDLPLAETYGESAEAFKQYISGLNWLSVVLVFAQVGLGQFEEAEAEINSRLQTQGNALAARMVVAAARGDQEQANRILATRKTELQEADSWGLLMHSWAGEREQANQIAARLDQHPFGAQALSTNLLWCLCGEAWDLAVTPNFAAKIEASGLPWPPASPINFPLKNW